MVANELKQNNLKPIFIVGPTATGKSELAYNLAKKLNGLIISADSMQIYKTLNIGTAKESVNRRLEIKHEMIDIITPDKNFSVAEFAEAAKKHIENAVLNNKTPIIAGGTGLYFESLLFPMNFAGTPKNDKIRKGLENELREYGAEYLHSKLKKIDPESALKLHANDTKRVIRAIEIVLSTGKSVAENADKKKKPIYGNMLMLGLNYASRDELYKKINARVDTMFEKGLLAEIASLIINSNKTAKEVFSWQSMQAIGYKEFADLMINSDYIENYQITAAAGQNTLASCDRYSDKINEIKEKIKQDTRNYAKRQLTWFRRYDFIKWFEPDNLTDAENFVLNNLK